MGEKEPYENKEITHSICPECAEKILKSTEVSKPLENMTSNKTVSSDTEKLRKLGSPPLPKFKETFGLQRREQMVTVMSAIKKYNTRMFDSSKNTEGEKVEFESWKKGSFPAFEYFVEHKIDEWAVIMGVPKAKYVIANYNSDIFYSYDQDIVIPIKLVEAFNNHEKLFDGLVFFIAHEFCHWVVEYKKITFTDAEDDERYANKNAEMLSGIMFEDSIVSMYNLLPEVWKTTSGDMKLQDAITRIKIAKSRGDYLARTVPIIKNNSVLRTSPENDGLVRHLGFEPSDSCADCITDIQLIEDSQRRLSKVTVIPDNQLTEAQKAHLGLAREIGRDISPDVKTIYAADIPPASDRVRTAGLYGRSTKEIFISSEQLNRGQNTIDTTIHEVSHHTSGADDAEEVHNKEMARVAEKVVESVSQGKFDKFIKVPGFNW